MQDLMEVAEVVTGRPSFVAFVRLLADDFANNAQSWEHISVNNYLEALAAWCEDSDRCVDRLGTSAVEPMTWRTLAEILLAARSYE